MKDPTEAILAYLRQVGARLDPDLSRRGCAGQECAAHGAMKENANTVQPKLLCSRQFGMSACPKSRVRVAVLRDLSGTATPDSARIPGYCTPLLSRNAPVLVKKIPEWIPTTGTWRPLLPRVRCSLTAPFPGWCLQQAHCASG
jgi:hypothetical protein